MDDVILSYNDIQTCVYNFVEQFQTDNKTFTHVVGIARGGLVPAVMLSHKLNIPMLTYSVSSYIGRAYNLLKSNQDESVFDVLDQDSSVLIVDDICDTGKTVQYMLKLLADIPVSVATITTKSQSKDKVDYHGAVVGEREWVTFPWEV